MEQTILYLQQKTHFINAVHSTTISNVYFCDEREQSNAFLIRDYCRFTSLFFCITLSLSNTHSSYISVCVGVVGVVDAVDFLVFFSCLTPNHSQKRANARVYICLSHFISSASAHKHIRLIAHDNRNLLFTDEYSLHGKIYRNYVLSVLFIFERSGQKKLLIFLASVMKNSRFTKALV